MQARLRLALLASLVMGCDGGRAGPADGDAARLGAGLPDAAFADAATPDAMALDTGTPDATTLDAASPEVPDAQAPDAAVVCDDFPAARPTPDGPLPPPASPHRGVDAWERPAWDRLAAAALADPGVHFIATVDRELDALVVEGGEPRARLVFRRDDAGEIAVLAGRVEDVFPRTDMELFGNLPDLLAAFDRAGAVPDAALGYAPDDPRVGWLPREVQSWPDPLARLAVLFEAPDAPDGVASLWPWATPAVSTHGGMGLLQSRATFVMSGAGARRGVVIDEAAALVDVAPTILAALRAPTTGGVGPDGTYADGLYLRRQDGRVRWEALDPCARPAHVVLLLFDGLLATELLHQTLADAPDVELPALRALVQDGVAWRYGAVVGFPSVSAPGHMTAGTGAWPGHHGVISNAFYSRRLGRPLNPFALIQDPGAFLMDPAGARAFYDDAVAPGVETLAQAAHRAFGAYDPETGAGAYVAVINELAIGGADWTTLDFLGAGKATLDQYRVADNLGLVQAEQRLGALDAPVPTILQLAWVSTDGAGEGAGPHSPLLRTVLTEMDARIARLRRALDRAGALDDTLFVLVSDHGMELQDPARAAQPGAIIAGSGVRLRSQADGLLYLRTLEADAVPSAGGLRVSVRDHDDGAPVVGATVSCAGCAPAVTDAAGQAELAVGDAAALDVTHPDFNPATLPVP